METTLSRVAAFVVGWALLLAACGASAEQKMQTLQESRLGSSDVVLTLLVESEGRFGFLTLSNPVTGAVEILDVEHATRLVRELQGDALQAGNQTRSHPDVSVIYTHTAGDYDWYVVVINGELTIGNIRVHRQTGEFTFYPVEK